MLTSDQIVAGGMIKRFFYASEKPISPRRQRPFPTIAYSLVA